MVPRLETLLKINSDDRSCGLPFYHLVVPGDVPLLLVHDLLLLRLHLHAAQEVHNTEEDIKFLLLFIDLNDLLVW